MMQCPSCSAPLFLGEARCSVCRALVNPPTQGASALAPRLVTPQNLEGLAIGDGVEPSSALSNPSEPMPLSSEQALSGLAPAGDEAWRREVLERVRKRRQARTHVLPLFVDGGAPSPPGELSQVASGSALPASPTADPGRVWNRSTSQSPQTDDELASLVPDDFDLPTAPTPPADDDPVVSRQSALGPSLDGPDLDPNLGLLDFALRPLDRELTPERSSAHEPNTQSLVERPRPASAPVGNRSLVADLPLVEPSRAPLSEADGELRIAPMRAVSRVASVSDRAQAALIDAGVWSAMSATAFYFASRIARTSIVGLLPAWRGLALFGCVLGAAYILFFSGLTGATPGKIACGIQVRRVDGTPLGPLAALARGALGLAGVALLGAGIWPALWDKDRRAVHDRVTNARVLLS